MLRYTIKKLGYGVLTLFGVVTVIFYLFHFLPGDPARMMLGQNESAEQLAAVKKKYGFDRPLGQQYLFYLNDLSPISWHSNKEDDYTFYKPDQYGGIVFYRGDSGLLAFKAPYLRDSFQKSGKKVSEVIQETLPNTAKIGRAHV